MIALGLLQERAVGTLGVPIIVEILGLATELVRLCATDSDDQVGIWNSGHADRTVLKQILIRETQGLDFL